MFHTIDVKEFVKIINSWLDNPRIRVTSKDIDKLAGKQLVEEAQKNE